MGWRVKFLYTDRAKNNKWALQFEIGVPGAVLWQLNKSCSMLLQLCSTRSNPNVSAHHSDFACRSMPVHVWYSLQAISWSTSGPWIDRCSSCRWVLNWSKLRFPDLSWMETMRSSRYPLAVRFFLQTSKPHVHKFLFPNVRLDRITFHLRPLVISATSGHLSI